jgi:hypothetical protein
MRDFSEEEFGRIFASQKPGFPGLRYRSGPGRRRPWLLRIQVAWASNDFAK